MADSAAEPSSTASVMSDQPSSSPASSGNYTFLEAKVVKPSGSQDSSHVSSDKPDRFAHTRTKRKRTSQEDFNILEAEYQDNPKPDKDTRASLANRVSLSEKEIQVWFQNRRQMTRRKRHTWQPNEITSIIRSSQDVSKEGPSRTVSPDSSFDTRPLSKDDSQVALEGDSSQTEEMTASEEAHTQENEPVVSPDMLLCSLGSSQSMMEITQSQDNSLVSGNQASTPRKLKRTSSMVRLAMSLDGQASVILRGHTPSPPSKHVLGNSNVRNALQRSKSMISQTSLVSSPDMPLAPPSNFPRIPGRSRDTRNWEFWCDSERRESLTKSAEINQRGSAAGAISLIRSTSSVIKADTKNEWSSNKRKSDGLEGHRPKLARTKSSAARLQASDESLGKAEHQKIGSTMIYVDGSDSDKENVDPNGSVTAPDQRRVATPRVLGIKRQVLQENNNLPSHSTSLGVLLARDKEKTPAKGSTGKTRPILANADKENILVDDQVAIFMKGARGEDDLDVAQNLLRLSQGAWR